MLKFLFLSLLLANLGLLCYERGYLDPLLTKTHEPERLAHELVPDKIRILSSAPEPKPKDPTELVADAKSGDKSGEKSADGVNKTAETARVCMEFGNFDEAQSKRFEAQLQALNLGAISHRSVSDQARNIIYIPPLASKDAVDKKATELRHLGVTDFFVMQDPGDMHFAISLGVFKTEDAARTRLAELAQKGVHSARLGTRNSTAAHVLVQWLIQEKPSEAIMSKLKLDFPKLENHTCEGSSNGQAASPAVTTTATTQPDDLRAARHALATKDVPHDVKR